MTDGTLGLFHPAIARWFSETYVAPTPAQALGWPRIAAGEHTLILAPTGSGKTLAAFLYAIHEMTLPVRAEDDAAPSGVHTLYLSPLKALANDIERNLEQPLRGIERCAGHLGLEWPQVRVAVRTGDTSATERQRMVRTPPHLLITTPESLHLLLTSVRAREILRAVRYVIVDEIHALCPNKRGTFLAILLERLEAITNRSPIRIGLSATQRPLSSVAGFLGGQSEDGTPRPVAIVDAGARRSMDLSVETPVEDMTVLPVGEDGAPSIWPAIFDRLVELVDEHESTLIFGNSRRVVERIASEMNRRIGYDCVQAHHGSISKERRHRLEQDLKAGRLPALVATSSMELGIDVGSIDLVCQVESPFSVASGLQRIGRAGHLVRATSKGRVIPKTRADLLQSAAMSRAMLRGEISKIDIPSNPLDVLAQQIVAMVAMDEWDVNALFDRIRCAAPYTRLTKEAFLGVLELVSGRFRSPEMPGLRPRISWDRAADRVVALPGARHLAILNGGVIPDTGQYSMVLEDGHTRLGELDEEFVFERRVGDTFVLGTGRWRILQISNDRVTVAPCEQSEAMMPFWKGEGLGHDWEFGERLGRLIRECTPRLDDASLREELERECALDEAGARNLVQYLSDQQRGEAPLPTDLTILLDVFRNEAGEERLAVISTFGRDFHLAFLLLLRGTLRKRGLEDVEAVLSNAGILLRLNSASKDAVLDAIHSFRSRDARSTIAEELEQSAYFALRFRRNAARALLLPRVRPGRRTPLWLQRLRSHDLLAFASRQPGFPIVQETYRELLEDVLPIAGLERFLADVEMGTSRFALRKERSPSPFSRSLLLDFTAQFLYLDDRPMPSDRSFSQIRDELGALVEFRSSSDVALDPDAIRTVEERLQGISPLHHARNGAELVELLRTIGDLSEDELAQRCAPEAMQSLPGLKDDRQVARIRIPNASPEERWVAPEEVAAYSRWSDADARWAIIRHVEHHAGCRPEEVIERYPIRLDTLARIASEEGWVDVSWDQGTKRWASASVVASIRRMTLSRRRRSVEPVTAEAYVRFLMRHQHVTAPRSGDDLDEVLLQLAGRRLAVPVWLDVLDARISGFHLELLSERVRDGAVSWVGGSSSGVHWLAFQVGDANAPEAERPSEGELPEASLRVVAFLQEKGASFLHEICAGLREPPSKVAPILWDLIWLSWVRNDSLDAALGGAPQPHQPSRRGRPLWGRGRWSLIPAESRDATEAATRGTLRTLLGRHGILTREVLASESSTLAWREAYALLTRMEWGGEADRAHFVSGLSGPQFGLRGVAHDLSRRSDEKAPVLVNVNDPVNAYGALFPILRPDGTRHIIRHHPGNYLVLDEGHPTLAIENRGERLIPLADLNSRQRRSALALLPQLVHGRERPPLLRVTTWSGVPVAGTAVAAELQEVGFVRDGASLVLYRRYD